MTDSSGRRGGWLWGVRDTRFWAHLLQMVPPVFPVAGCWADGTRLLWPGTVAGGLCPVVEGPVRGDGGSIWFWRSRVWCQEMRGKAPLCTEAGGPLWSSHRGCEQEPARKLEGSENQEGVSGQSGLGRASGPAYVPSTWGMGSRTEAGQAPARGAPHGTSSLWLLGSS